jgi:hypothetical protein
MLTNIRVASKNGSYTDLALNVEDPHLPSVGENLVWNGGAENAAVVSRQFEYVQDTSGPSPVYVLYVNLWID